MPSALLLPLDALIEALPLAMLVVDARTRLVFLNHAAEELIGSGKNRIAGKSLADIWPHTNLQGLLKRAEDSRGVIKEHRLLLESFQQRMEVRVSVVPLQGDYFMVLLEALNQSELREEEEIKQRIAETSGLMAAMLAHEIKNPLAGIRGAAQLLGMEASEENTALSQLICAEVDRIRDMVERVECLSASDNHAQAVNIHEVLRYACSLANAGKGKHSTQVLMEEQFDPSLPPVCANRAALIQLFLNLLKNAAEALAWRDNPVICLKTHIHHASSRFVAIEVSDNGHGVPDELRHKLFEPFSSTRGQGRGLGLAIAARLASNMGGNIELMQNKEENGACFRIILPLARQSA